MSPDLIILGHADLIDIKTLKIIKTLLSTNKNFSMVS